MNRYDCSICEYWDFLLSVTRSLPFHALGENSVFSFVALHHFSPVSVVLRCSRHPRPRRISIILLRYYEGAFRQSLICKENIRIVNKHWSSPLPTQQKPWKEHYRSVRVAKINVTNEPYWCPHLQCSSESCYTPRTWDRRRFTSIEI